jgi:hypothetical protein
MSPPVNLLWSRLDNKIIERTTGGVKFQIYLARFTNETDQNVVKRLMPESLAGLTDVLPLLDTGEAVLLGDAVLLPTRIKLDLPKITPDSSTRDFWSEWANRCPDNDAIIAAVECLRSQTRKVS